MADTSREQLNVFTTNSLPNLDIAVLGALELFQQEKLPEIDVSAYKHPLVVGSGNAEATGRIIFGNVDAVFASESTYEGKLENIDAIDGVILISASGEKHAPIIARRAKELGKPVALITNSKVSSAGKEADHTFVFPKNREPYTYNTSTYMGMILGHTQEDPVAIAEFIEKEIATLDLPDLSPYDKFFLIVPPEFAGIIRMLQVKFIELFGRKIAHTIETSEYVKHATTVVKSDELFIAFGEPNVTWGEEDHRLNVPLPEDAGYGAMMAVGYYMIAQIQKAHPPYFKDRIEEYTKDVSRLFAHPVSPIVE